MLMDNSMPIMNGLEATPLLKEELPLTKVLVFGAEHLSYSLVVRWGAEGYVSKLLAPMEEQLAAVREVLREGIETITNP
jgi:DNA-binding NarL/FixJ family response regulator